MGSLTEVHKKVIIVLLLVLLPLVIYWNVQDFGFTNYDDHLYVTENYQVQEGLTWRGALDVFYDISTGNWHPLTMLSHMLDWELFGWKAGGHHWTNVLLHILNGVLLFLLLHRLTGALWRSALVAALFAVHPLNVESVAWVSERKNVLSSFFWFLTLLFYVGYARQPGWKRYLPVLICFVLGLMSKAMLVTLPFVLLLMDYWPLNRTVVETGSSLEKQGELSLAKVGWGRLIWEKTPLFFLTAVFSAVTLYAQHSTDALSNLDVLPLFTRLQNAVVAYSLYLKKMVWPFDLSVFYPYNKISPDKMLLSLSVIFLLSGIVFCLRKQRYLTVGWFWFLGTLVPVIGLVQVGHQSIADRYAYIPLVGLFIAMSWGMGEFTKINKYLKNILTIIFMLFLLALSVVCWQRCQLWGDEVALWSDVLKNHQQAFAYNFLGLAYAEKGQNDLAMKNYALAIAIDPGFAEALNNRGILNARLNQFGKALNDYDQSIRINPRNIPAYYNRGRLHLKMNRREAAFSDFTQVLRINANLPKAYLNRGFIFGLSGRHDLALAEYQKALRIHPTFLDAYFGRGISLLFMGRYKEAALDFHWILQRNPNHIGALNNMGLVLAAIGQYGEAAKQYRKILQIQPNDQRALANLQALEDTIKQQGRN